MIGWRTGTPCAGFNPQAPRILKRRRTLRGDSAGQFFRTFPVARFGGLVPRREGWSPAFRRPLPPEGGTPTPWYRRAWAAPPRTASLRTSERAVMKDGSGETEELLARLRQGDQQALAELYSRQ